MNKCHHRYHWYNGKLKCSKCGHRKLLTRGVTRNISIAIIACLIIFLVYQNFGSITKYLNPVEKTVINTSQKIISDNKVTNSNPKPDNNVPELEQKIHLLINQQRQSSGLTPLNYDSELATIARAHSQDMMTNNYFEHVDLGGLNVDGRYLKAGYNCKSWYGENIWYAVNISALGLDNGNGLADKVVNDWMNSQIHRDNILRTTFQNEGIGVVLVGGNVDVTEDFC